MLLLLLLNLLLLLLLIFVAIGDFIQEHPGIRQQVIPSIPRGTSLKLMLLLLLWHPNLLRLLLGQSRGQLGRGSHRRGGGSPKHAEATSGTRRRRRSNSCSCSSSSIAQSIPLKFAVPGLVEELGELTIHCSRTHALTPSRTHTSTSLLVERGSRCSGSHAHSHNL